MKTFRILLLLLGFFAMPALTYACGTGSGETGKSCCKEEQPEPKACCASHEAGQDTGDGCDGKCGQDSCHCPIAHNSFALPFFSLQLKDKHFHGLLQKVKSYDKEVYLSPGFYSLWLPPKIG